LSQLTNHFFAGAAGTEEAQGRALATLGSQVRLQSFTLAYQDGFLAIALVAVLTAVLAMLLKPVKLPAAGE
jgi:hypothetical protein